jgi:hypothetical protein
MRKLNLEIIPQGGLNHLSIEAILWDNIVMAQQRNKGVRIIKQKLAQEEGKYKCFRVDFKGIIWFNERVVVPKDHELRKHILDEAHLSKFSMHPVWQNQPELYRLKYASPFQRAPTYFKRYNPLACRVTSR